MISKQEKIQQYYQQYYLRNKGKLLQQTQQYRLRNKEKLESARLLKKYGITLEDYRAIHKKQNGVCAICKQPAIDSKLCVDHDHISGDVRGLLCRTCNQALGLFYEDVDRLQAAIEYLLAFKE